MKTAEFLTPEQVRDKFIEGMEPDLGELYFDLYTELGLLHIKWRQFLDLYGKDPARVDLLNQIAPEFFGRLQTTLYEDVILHMARMTDPKETGRQRQLNLTLRRIAIVLLHCPTDSYKRFLCQQLSLRAPIAIT